MFYLYLKTHNQTRLKYLGYTKNDPMKYKGSGTYWTRHLKKYGNDVSTEILLQSENIDDISREGRLYSEMWNVANSEEFANFCEEDGNKLYGKANINFKGHPQTPETREKISKNHSRNMLGRFGPNHPGYGHKVPPHLYKNVEYMIAKARTVGPWNKGKAGVQTVSEETRKKMSASASKTPKPTVTCPKCGKTGGKPAMIRFHFDNCKDTNTCV